MLAAAALAAAGCDPIGSGSEAPVEPWAGRGAGLAVPTAARTPEGPRAARVVGEYRGAPLWRKEVLSPRFEMDRVYTSMRGPYRGWWLELDAPATRVDPELLWVTGFDVQIRAPDGAGPASEEFLCHSNLNVDAASYALRHDTELRSSPRLFTLSQGQRSVRLPEGFGLPLRSDQPLQVETQALNHNVVDRSVAVRHRLELDYVRDADLDAPLVPLVQQAVFGYVLAEGPDPYFGLPPGAEPDAFGTHCVPGVDAGDSGFNLVDEYGRHFSSFWVVPPGRHSYRSRVLPSMLELPWDTTVHHIAAHVHPWAESIALVDRTSGETVYEARVRQAERGIGLADVEVFSSAAGIPLYRDHTYDLVTVYDNRSGEKQDSMAVLYLYLRAKDFEARPSG